MRTWWDNKYCVRFLKTFQAMPWQYRVLDFSVFLAPISMTLSCLLEPTNGVINIEYRILAVILWLVSILHVVNFVRGWLALRRGVQAAPPGKKHNTRLDKWGIFATGVILGLMILAESILAVKHGLDLDALATTFFIAALFFQSLSSYVRSRFWALTFE